MAKKFYVIWQGKVPGIYTDWETAKFHIHGVKGAEFKSFKTFEEAKAAFEGKNAQNKSIVQESIAVDAACSGNPGVLEYQGVWVKTGERLFHQGPFKQGTNNIGEFLALVHALAYQREKQLAYPIYTDSKTAQAWLRNKAYKTTLNFNHENTSLKDLLDRAIVYVKNHCIQVPIYTWNTREWGEIPADFGRKS